MRLGRRWPAAVALPLALSLTTPSAEATLYATHYIVVLDDRPDSVAVKRPGVLQGDLTGQARLLPWDSEAESLLTVVNIGFGGRKPLSGCVDPQGPVALFQGKAAQPFRGRQQGTSLLLAMTEQRRCWGRAQRFSPAAAPLAALAAVGEILAREQPRLAFEKTVITVATDEPAAHGEGSIEAMLRDDQDGTDFTSVLRGFSFGRLTRRKFDTASLLATEVPIRRGEGREQRYWEWRPEPSLRQPPTARATIEGGRLVLDLGLASRAFRPIWLAMPGAGRRLLDLIACGEGGTCELDGPRLLIEPAALGDLPESGSATLLWRYVPSGLTYRGTFVPTPFAIALAAPAAPPAPSPQLAPAAAPPVPAPPQVPEATGWAWAAMVPWYYWLLAAAAVLGFLAWRVLRGPSPPGRIARPLGPEQVLATPPRRQLIRLEGPKLLELWPEADELLALTVEPVNGHVLTGAGLVLKAPGITYEPGWGRVEGGGEAQELSDHEARLELPAGRIALKIRPDRLRPAGLSPGTVEAMDCEVTLAVDPGQEGREEHRLTLRFHPAPADRPELEPLRPLASLPAQEEGGPWRVTRPRPSEPNQSPIASLTIRQPPADRPRAAFEGELRLTYGSSPWRMSELKAGGGARLDESGEVASVRLPPGAWLTLGLRPDWDAGWAMPSRGASELGASTLLLQSGGLELSQELPALMLDEPKTEVELVVLGDGPPKARYELLSGPFLSPIIGSLPDVVVEAAQRESIWRERLKIRLLASRKDERLNVMVKVPAEELVPGLKWGLRQHGAEWCATLGGDKWEQLFEIGIDPRKVDPLIELDRVLEVRVTTTLLRNDAEPQQRECVLTQRLWLRPGPRPTILCVDIGTSAIAASYWDERRIGAPIDLQHQPVCRDEEPSENDQSLAQRDSANPEKGDRSRLLPSFVGLGSDSWVYQGEKSQERQQRLTRLGRRLNIALPFAPFGQLSERWEEVVYAPKSQLGRLGSTITRKASPPPDGSPAGSDGQSIKQTIPVHTLLEEMLDELGRSYLFDERYKGGSLVLTAPNSFGPVHQGRFRDAVTARLALRLKIGREQIEIVSESDAAAFYFLHRPDPQQAGTKRVLLYDLGAGTLDLSLIETRRDQQGKLEGWCILDQFGVGVAGNALDEALARAAHAALLDLANTPPTRVAGLLSLAPTPPTQTAAIETPAPAGGAFGLGELVSYPQDRWLARPAGSQPTADDSKRILAFHGRLQAAKTRLSQALEGGQTYGWEERLDVHLEIELSPLDSADEMVIPGSTDQLRRLLAEPARQVGQPGMVIRTSGSGAGEALFLQLPRSWLADMSRLDPLMSFLTRDMIKAVGDRNPEVRQIDRMIFSGRAALWPMFHDKLRSQAGITPAIGRLERPAAAAQMKEAVVGGAAALVAAKHMGKIDFEDRARRRLALMLNRFGERPDEVELAFEDDDWAGGIDLLGVSGLSLYEVISRRLWEEQSPDSPWREHVRTALGFYIPIRRDHGREAKPRREDADEPGQFEIVLGDERFPIDEHAEDRAPRPPWPLRSIFLDEGRP